jgi:hypothetical protein
MDQETMTAGGETRPGRIPERVAPTHVEHPDLDPDGVPHDVIAILAFDAWVIAATCLLALLWSLWFVVVGAVVLFVSVLLRLDRRAKRERRQRYPDVPDLQK